MQPRLQNPDTRNAVDSEYGLILNKKVMKIANTSSLRALCDLLFNPKENRAGEFIP